MIKTTFTILFLVIFLLISCKTDQSATQEISKEEITKKTAETEITTVSTVSADKKLFLTFCGTSYVDVEKEIANII